MSLFPMFVDLRGRAVLVIGGGEVATRKVLALLQAGARVRVHALAWAAELEALREEGQVERLDGRFDPAWLDDAWLVVAATDDGALNREVAAAAQARHRWVNVVDDAALSSYQVPAVIDRAPLQIAISSAGAAPMLARQLRERLETELDHALGPLATLFAQHRQLIREHFPDTSVRRRWFEQVLEGPVPALVREGDLDAAARRLRQSLAEPANIAHRGQVALIGCDGEDPSLLTLKALRLLNQADRLLVDAAIAAPVLAMARRDASVEPMPGPAALLARLAELAANGQRVACLRAGAGFFDADGLAVARALRSAGIACENVPPPWSGGGHAAP